MSNKVLSKEVEQKQKEKDNDLLDDFKKEVFVHGKRNIFAVVSYALLIVVVFSLLGIASYQIFFKPEKVENKVASEKIESTPIVMEEPKQEEPAVTTPQPTEVAPTPTVTDYTVQSGDTWSSIANSHDMSSTELMKYNNSTTESLQIGQVVKIPQN